MGASDQLLRLTSVSYADGISEMRTGTDPVAISRIVFDQDGDMPNDAGISSIFVTWGQFVDHDLSLTPDASGEHVFSPGLVRPLERSVFDEETGTDSPREQVNVITPGMDASMVYGSDDARTASLRSFEGGLLKMDPSSLLEKTTAGMAGASEERPLYLAGDIRANENPALTALHTVFCNEHNFWAKRIAAEQPDWTDDQIFEAARAIIEYEIQTITYRDWLPKLIGDAADLPNTYGENVDGRISTEFSTAGFRFGHTMVSPVISQIDETGETVESGDISIRDAFFNISQIELNGVAGILRGQASDQAQMSDALLIDDLNFFLESPAGVQGFSLAALNILRGRDHGIGTYVEVRAELLGDIDPETLDPTDFSIITSDADAQARLAEAYGSVLEVDTWVGGLAEDDVPGTQLGALFTHIVGDQFARTRYADDSFGALPEGLSAALLADVRESTLSDIVTRSSDVTYLQEDIFLSANRIAGDDGYDFLSGTADSDLIIGFDGTNTLFARDGDDAIYGGAHRDFIAAGSGDDLVDGGNGSNYLYGNGGDDTLNGGDHRDRMDGGNGNDVASGGAGDDYIRGRSGDDTLDGGDNRDIIYGDSGSDVMNGGNGRDKLNGGNGHDVLNGGAGMDYIWGGRGQDVFVFEAGNDYDVVRDFDSGTDKILLKGFGIDEHNDILGAARQSWFSVRIEFGDDVMILSGTRFSDLSADDFMIA